ncbi:hypothetical protein HY442_00260 [Candidatus Parcubacteria bacterium]|nr:hypothetical protein [Candidatus Parcubacteria bacterium]
MVLTKKQEQALFAKIAKGDTSAKGMLLAANVWLVKKIAEHYVDSKRGLPLRDLIRIGQIGLEKALEHYRPTKRYKFSTYATWWIREAIHRTLGIKTVDT